MNRILAAMLAAASCATMAQAQVGPSAPVAQDAPVYTLDQAVSAAGGSAPAAEAATAGIDAARAGRTVAGLRPNPVVQGQVENVIGSGPYRGVRSAETTVGFAIPVTRASCPQEHNHGHRNRCCVGQRQHRFASGYRHFARWWKRA